MLRFTVDALAPVDLAGARIVIGASPAAQLRLPAEVARDEHVVVSEGRWVALATLDIDGASRAAGDSGPIGAGVTLGFGAMRVVIAPAPAGSLVSSPAHTASLALELVRGLLGANAAPSFEVERGPVPGAKRVLPPPVASLVIGRGDEATWVILDEDLSRTHAEIQRGWDGVTIVDLGSKNGTKLDGARIAEPTPLRDGMRIELGNVVLRFRDPAERHLRGGTVPEVVKRNVVAAIPAAAPARSPWPFLIATAVAGLAVVGLVWVLAT
ncbi:MAG: FHA domain-containing protein [Myxococcales bacterium]|nr:FHA domain-containing protein [Myxococcales bacterium]